MRKKIDNKNKREVDMTILWNDNGWSSGNTNRKLHKITIDNELFEYRIATKKEVKMCRSCKDRLSEYLKYNEDIYLKKIIYRI